jgi:hypothetical protein
MRYYTVSSEYQTFGVFFFEEKRRKPKNGVCWMVDNLITNIMLDQLLFKKKQGNTRIP